MLNYKLQALEMVDNFTIDLLNCVTMMVGEGVFEMGDKMSFLTPFTFNAVELQTVLSMATIALVPRKYAEH